MWENISKNSINNNIRRKKGPKNNSNRTHTTQHKSNVEKRGDKSTTGAIAREGGRARGRVGSTTMTRTTGTNTRTRASMTQGKRHSREQGQGRGHCEGETTQTKTVTITRK